jgi:hypothetical protein
MAKRPRSGGGAYTPRSGPFAGQPSGSYRQHRNRIAQAKGFASLSAQQKARAPSGLSPPQQAVASRAWKARQLRLADRNLSKREAARQAGTTPNAIAKYVGPAWPSSIRRWSFLTEDGVITLDVRGKRTKSVLGKYDNALRAYLEGRGDGELRKFRGKSITVNGIKYQFLIDTDRIDELGDAGELRIEYASGDAAD